jgi:Phage portal protein, SPP1 Gp6-like
MTISVTTKNAPDGQNHGISRNLVLGRVLHFEALMRRRLGEARTMRYVRLHNYYANQNLPPDNVDQPLAINYFARIIDKHTNYLWGQWKERLFTWRVTPIDKESMSAADVEDAEEYGRKIKLFLDKWYDDNDGNVVMLQGSKNGSLYGDSVFEVRYDEWQRLVVLDPVLPEYFYCMWDPSNMRNLEEVVVAYPIDRVVAYERWGSSGNDHFIGYQALNPMYAPGVGVLWKRWSPVTYQVWIDDVNIVNIANPYAPQFGGNLFPGVIPFIHIPNMQTGGEYWGYGDAEAVLTLQDELNRRLADMGDILQNHAHPIITLSNFRGQQEDLPVGPDAIWDLGTNGGKAERLDGTGPGQEAMAYVNEVKLTMHETASMPEQAYGTQRGGSSHNSGIALSMAMMPVVERSREKRIRWATALRKLAKMVLYMYYIRDPKLLESQGIDYSRTRLYNIEPVFADILPKDELQEVNENVALYANGLRSLERALEKLGEEDVSAEVKRIVNDLKTKASLAQPTPPAEGGTTGKNSDQGLGGAAELPGGIGANAGKPGTLIKSPTLDQVDSVAMSKSA